MSKAFYSLVGRKINLTAVLQWCTSYPDVLKQQVQIFKSYTVADQKQECRPYLALFVRQQFLSALFSVFKKHFNQMAPYTLGRLFHWMQKEWKWRTVKRSMRNSTSCTQRIACLDWVYYYMHVPKSSYSVMLLLVAKSASTSSLLVSPISTSSNVKSWTFQPVHLNPVKLHCSCWYCSRDKFQEPF